MNRVMGLSTSVLFGALILATNGQAAESGGVQGASTWGEQYPYWCTQGGEGMCRYYSDPNTPTGQYVTGCGGLYWFHTHYYVLVYCGSLP